MRWLFVFVLGMTSAVAQLQLRIVSSLDSTQYPLLSVIAECTMDGIPTVIDAGRVAIASSRFSIRPQSVETLNPSRGRVRISWLADPRLITESNLHILAWQGSALARDSVPLPRMPIVRIVTQRSTPLEELTIRAAPGTTTSEQFYLQLYTGRYSSDGLQELPIRVDSIVSSIPFVRVEWVGWAGGTTSLPSVVYSPLLYLVRVHCTPPDTSFSSGTITIYYDGALALVIPITINQFPLPGPQQLRFEWPQGAELLAPCQTVTVRWTGMAFDSRVALDYSLDSGATWEPIVSTTDSSAQWSIPNVPTRGLRFRLRQLDAQQRSYQLDDRSPTAVTRLTFRRDGKRLLSMHAINGELVEWDVGSRQITWRALPPDIGQVQPIFVAYIDTTRVLAVYNALNRGYAALFRIGDATPLWSGQVYPTAIGNAALDTAHATLALIAKISSAIELMSISNNSIQSERSITLPMPATALTITGGEALVALLDSRIVLYQTPDWLYRGEYHLPFLPRVALLYAMPDGKRLAIGCSVSQPSVVQGLSAPVFVLDKPSAQLVRSRREAASTPVAVTASSDARYLVFGYRGQPQSPLWDLSVDMVTSQVSVHQGALADISFSPDQRLVASSSSTPPLELVIRTFLFPETVVSNPLTIGTVALESDTLDFSPTYAYASVDTTFRARLCNRGTVPLPLGEHWVEGEPAFQLVNLPGSDTLQPGECRDIAFRFTPGRAGRYQGAFVIRHCEQVLRLPLRGRAIERTVTVPDTINVGTSCVGSTVREEFVILTNEDPAPLPIGGATIYDAVRSPFRLIAPPRDTVIGGRRALSVLIEFAPSQAGMVEGTLYVTYGWRDYTALVVLRGVGVGGTLEPHIQPLPFIPEQPVRTLRLRNRQPGPLTLTAARVEPNGGFRVVGEFPRTVQSGDSAAIQVEWLDQDSSRAVLVVEIEPCSSILRIPLVRYSAHAELRVPVVRGDVHGRVSIPLLLRVNSNTDYGDPLVCTLRVAMHPRLLSPDTVWTPRGNARLVDQRRIGDRRVATIAVVQTLNYPQEDTLAVMGGIAALGEQDSSHLTFFDGPYWGRAVDVTTTSGVMYLEGFCGDRRTFEDRSLRMTINPSPAVGDAVTIVIESTSNDHGELLLHTTRGELHSRIPVELASGTRQILFSTGDLEPGIYVFTLVASGSIVRVPLVVVR